MALTAQHTTSTTVPLQQPAEARRNLAELMRALHDAQREDRYITATEARRYAGAILTLDHHAAALLGIDTTT